MRQALIPILALALAACQPAADTDATGSEADPAQPASAPPAEPASVAPPAFVGAWAADLAWCSNTIGPERPLVVTATEFRGYENTCQITGLQPADGGWTATFVCSAQGETTSQPVGVRANERELTISWLDNGYSVSWQRCPA